MCNNTAYDVSCNTKKLKGLIGMAEDLEKIEKWLLDYDGSEYALLEIRNLIKALRAKSTEAIIRYDNRVKSFSK